jgi:hypothetical protein
VGGGDGEDRVDDLGNELRTGADRPRAERARAIGGLSPISNQGTTDLQRALTAVSPNLMLWKPLFSVLEYSRSDVEIRHGTARREPDPELDRNCGRQAGVNS